MSRQLILFSLLLTFSTSCSQFQTGRTYLSEMEHDDTRFFNPKDDFPVVAGDTGRDWSTEREMRERIPASESDMFENRAARALKMELRELEGNQSEESTALYEKHKTQLATTSERIYYLKLPPRERKDYLMSRGFISEPKTPMYTANERMFAVRKQDILLGMTKNDVMESWGKPVRIEIAGNPRNENERWLYRMNGTAKYIYFESGEVQGWE